MNSTKNSHSENPSKNSRQENPAKNSRQASERSSRAGAGAHTHETHEPPEVIAQRLKALKRQQAKGVARGVILVLALPVTLCALFAILKACGLLLFAWPWCFAPLALLLIPLAAFCRGYVAAVKAWRAQSKGMQPKDTKGEKA